ncbi:hypothetical protein D5086_022689 [Populus alba]|uniref:Uncharacterized protein n=1 Tax=Populus alba TaxID=43335 RepID=A0ACC4BGC6_POPAL
MFLPFFFIACCTVPSSADKPSYYIPPDTFVVDCSSSVAPHDAGFPYDQKYEIDFSSVSRVYVVDPSSSEKPRISACIFRKQVTWPFIVSDGPKFIRLYFKLVTYSGLNISKALFSINVGPYTLITTSESSYSKYSPNSDYAIREFCVNMDGQAPFLHGTGIPIYRDYIVNFSRYGEGIEYLIVATGSNNGSSAEYGGPILNGLEIFKLSDIHPFGLIVTPHPNFSVDNDAVIIYRVLCARPAVIPMGEIEEEEHEKLAMKQQEGAAQQEAGSVQKEVNRRKNDDLSIMIDGQRCIGFDISDPTLGVEFSEIMAPTGR